MHLFERRLALFTGKGGVGKSTLVAAAAFEAARQGRAPLIVELGHRATMASIFGVAAIGHEPVEVAPGVFATNVETARALESYVHAHVPVRALARRIARSRSLGRFFDAAPAVTEILTLDRLEHLLKERWDPILVDFDATGHARMFLELPRLFEGLVPSGPIRRLLDSFAALLADRDRTVLHLVTLPDRLPVQETLELHAHLAEQRTVALGALVVNRVPAAPIDPRDRDLVDALRAHAHGAFEADLALLARAEERSREVRRRMVELERTGLPIVALPSIDGPVDAAALRRLGAVAGGVA